jgi:hypothetical protein
MTVDLLRVRMNLLLLYYRKAKVQGLIKSTRVLLNPHRLAFHVWRLIMGNARARSNFYVPSISLGEELYFCRRMSGCTMDLVRQAFAELASDRDFLEGLRLDYDRLRSDSPVPFSVGRLKVWYVLVRLLRPNVVIETGVHDGLSSALILRALERNQRGLLVSIDLPSVELPIGVDGPGWLVPASLRARWILRLGDSRKLLPALAREYAPVEMFIHDSDHAAEFQRFEYETVRAFLGGAGLLLTDDARFDLLTELAKRWGVDCVLIDGGKVPGSAESISIGGLRFCGPG